MKDKIFFIGQNAVKGNQQLMPTDVSLNQQARQQTMKRNQQQKKLTKNTMKSLQKLHEKQAQDLKYATFEKMNTLWL